MPLRLKTTMCEICNKKKFVMVLQCKHTICLECKQQIKKVEEMPKCPFCRVLFNPLQKVIERSCKGVHVNIKEIESCINWESYESVKLEYNSELDEGRIWV